MDLVSKWGGGAGRTRASKPMTRCPLQSSQSLYGTPARILCASGQAGYLRVSDIPPRIPRSVVGLGAARTISEVVGQVNHRGITEFSQHPCSCTARLTD